MSARLHGSDLKMLAKLWHTGGRPRPEKGAPQVEDLKRQHKERTAAGLIGGRTKALLLETFGGWVEMCALVCAGLRGTAAFSSFLVSLGGRWE